MHGVYSTGSQVRLKLSMLKSSSYDYSDTYILVSGTIVIIGETENETGESKRTDKRNKELILKNCAPFTECASEISNAQIDHDCDTNV